MKNIVKIPNFPLVVAVSGGADSMALLHFCLKNIEKKHIFVAHFHHGLRAEEADRDADFVKNFCEKNHIAFFSERQNIFKLAQTEKMSIEAAARKFRYIFLAKIYEKVDAKALLTAHHLDDRIETALFYLIRGTKFSGLNSLKFQENRLINGKNICILRPFFYTEKSEILDYLQENTIEFCQDSSNDDVRFQRNFLRNEILPKFTKINPEYRKAFWNFLDYTDNFLHWEREKVYFWLMEQWQKYQKKWENFEKKMWKKISYIFSIADFQLLEKMFQFAIFEYIFYMKNHGNFGLSEGLLSEFLRFTLQWKNSFGTKTVKNLILQRRGDFIFVMRGEIFEKTLDFSKKYI